MTAPAPTAFEDQIRAGLRQRADKITPPPDARDLVDARIAQRTRNRRLRRAGAAAIVALAIVAATLAIVQGGTDDASVVTTPGVPAVHIPQLGLPPGMGATELDTYSPGRRVELSLFGGHELASSDQDPVFLGGHLTLTVTDASPGDVLASMGPIAPVRQATVDGKPAQLSVISQGSSAPVGVVVWRPTPEVLAVLTDGVAPTIEDPAERVRELADGLVELDDAAWLEILDPGGEITTSPMLGLTGDGGVAEMRFLAHGSVNLALHTPGDAPATFELVAIGGATPDTFNAVDDPDHVSVRGTSGLVGDAPDYLTNAYGYTRTLSWVEDGILLRLDFTDAATPADAVDLAERLSPLSPDQWHALLFPTTLRVDLVPMPSMGAMITPMPSDGSDPPPPSLPETTTSSTPPTTGD